MSPSLAAPATSDDESNEGATPRRRAPSFSLASLRVEAFRNLADATFEPSDRINVVFGQNGQGKTSLLEAIYVVATTKSFRTARLREVTTHQRGGFSVRASFIERRGDLPSLERQHTAVYAEGSLHVRLDGNRPQTLADYAVRSPVVVFHPEELTLSTGPAALRRRLLDRVALYRSPTVAAELSRYTRALRARQELLRRGATEAELTSYESILASSGSIVSRARREAVESLVEPTLEAFRRIAAPDLELTLRYRNGGSEDSDAFARELEQRRSNDRNAVTATFGPHRDELELKLNGRAARQVASQGQHRAITLSLKAAETNAVTSITGLEPIQLLDDVSSELDRERTEALLIFLAETRGQVFATTTRPELLTPSLGPENTKLFQVVNGELKSA
ncbi:MAG: DNA replication and repair protein RecF [Polyangiaceae bacterium]|nr:DNA replication and repair protein RecF [Polyangiaceae bacterium]